MRGRFILLWVLREIRASWPYFIATVLCVTCAVFSGSLILRSNHFWRCVTPSWASHSTTILLLKPNVEDRFVGKIRQILETSPWVEAYEVVRKEKALSDFKALNPDLAQLLKDLDPAYIPVYFKIVTGEKCLTEYSQCEHFFKSLGSMEAVDQLYSGLVWAGVVFRWFNYAKKVMMLSVALFMIISLTLSVLLNRLICESRAQELYLWETLGASPTVMKVPFLLYSSFVILPGIVAAWAIFYFLGLVLKSKGLISLCHDGLLLQPAKDPIFILPGVVMWAITMVVVNGSIRFIRRRRGWGREG